MNTLTIIIFTVILTLLMLKLYEVLSVILKNARNRIKHSDGVINRVFLIDIDGTICADIKNEYSELYPQAMVFESSKDIINKWYDEGNEIHFFTARESKDRDVTIKWLDENGFKYHGLIMDKPRIKDGWEYAWIDNRKVRAVTYLGTWSELKEVRKKILLFN
jgi:hypothetical protein